MLLKTVEYEIPKDGNCRNCKCLIEHEYYNYCKAFDDTMNWYGDRDKLKECKAYIKEQTQCMKCIHQGDYPDWECDIGKDPKTCEEWSE